MPRSTSSRWRSKKKWMWPNASKSSTAPRQLIKEAQSMSVLAYVQMTNAYRSDRIKNLTPMMGEGIGSFWTDINMEVIQGDGYVRTGATSPLKNLNPVAAKDHLEFMELRMIYDRLFRISPEGKAEPWAAESYKVVDPTTSTSPSARG